MSTATALFPLPHALDVDRLGDEIARLSAEVDTAIARLLTLIREFDDQRGWSNGFRSCAEWLAWRVGLDIVAARERVRIARALGTLPILSGALKRGDLSYTKVRALTRVATPENEARLLTMGRTNTAEQIGRIVRGRRMLDGAAERREAKRQHESRALSAYRDESGMVVIHGRLDPEGGAVFMQALAAAQDALYRLGRQRAGGREADTDDSPGPAPSAIAPRSGVPLPRVRPPVRPGASHPTLGSWRTDHAGQPRTPVPSAPPGGAPGRVSGRA